MPIVVETGTTFPSTTTQEFFTTALDICKCASRDIRGVLDVNNPEDQVLLLDFLNRISLDLLRHARWVFLLSGPVSFQTTATPNGQTTNQNNQYWLGLTGQNPSGVIDAGLNLSDLDIIKRDTVIDYTNMKRLANSELEPVAQEFLIPAKPRIWQVLSSAGSTMVLWPAPVDVYTISFRYYKARIQVTNLNQVIQIPSRYKDIVCHGVTWYAFQYLKEMEGAQMFQQLYLSGKVQIIKDMNLFPRAEEFIRPDPSSVTRQTTTGIGLDSGLETSIP